MAPQEVSHPLSIAFFTLWFIPTFSGLPLLLAALVFGKDVERRPAVASMTLALFICGVSHSILLFASKFNLAHIIPSAAVCSAQAALTSGLDVMLLVAMMGILYGILAEIRDVQKGESYKAASKLRKPLQRAALVVPYVAWVVFIITSAIVFSTTHSQVNPAAEFARNGGLPYCSENGGLIDSGAFWLNSILYGILLGFEITVLVKYIRMRSDSMSWAILPHDKLARDAILLVIMTITMGTRAAYVPLRSGPAPDLMLASAALLHVGIYGSHTEILRVWGRIFRTGGAFAYMALGVP